MKNSIGMSDFIRAARMRRIRHQNIAFLQGALVEVHLILYCAVEGQIGGETIGKAGLASSWSPNEWE